jgi:L-2-hydroxycarboxylate dehydrogenase (NAD+)
MKISIEELKQITTHAIKSYGYSDAETAIILEVIMYAQLRGNNQGIVKLIGKGIPKDENASEIRIVKETKLSALIDGGKNFGMVVMMKALSIALDKAKEHGFAIVGTNNTASSTGAIGYYAKKIAEQGLIGFVYAGSPEAVCHYGSIEPKYGTNPLAVGIPTADNPIVLDMATAAISWFGLVEAKTAGKSIPPNVAIDSDGNPTIDPAKAMDGAILPFDRGYKGAGLSMLVETLTGPLVGATFVGIGKGDWGNLIYIIDPELLIDLEKFKQNMIEMVECIKSSKKVSGVDEIYMPGEKGEKRIAHHLDIREIEVEDNLINELKQVAAKQSRTES